MNEVKQEVVKATNELPQCRCPRCGEFVKIVYYYSDKDLMLSCNDIVSEQELLDNKSDNDIQRVKDKLNTLVTSCSKVRKRKEKQE